MSVQSPSQSIENEPYYLQVPDSAGKLRQRFANRYSTQAKISNLQQTQSLFKSISVVLMVLIIVMVGLMIGVSELLGTWLTILIIFASAFVVIQKLNTTDIEIEVLKKYAIEYEYLEFYDRGLVVSPFMKVGLSYDVEQYFKYGYQYLPHNEIVSISVPDEDQITFNNIRGMVVRIETSSGEKFRLNFEEAPYFKFDTDNYTALFEDFNQSLEEFKRVDSLIHGRERP